MLAGVTPELRRQIFELAAGGMARTTIARTLGISEGSVRYQLEKPARPAGGGEGTAQGVGIPAVPPALASGAPDPLHEARTRLALEQIATSELDLKARRVEAERRLALLEKAPGGDAGAVYMVLRELGELRHDLERVQAKAAAVPATPGTPAPSFFDQLAQLRQSYEAVRVIGGDDKTPTTELELNAKVTLDRLNMEREDRQRELDFRYEERRRELDND